MTFYIYPGWRAEEIAAGLVASGVQITPDEFMRVVNNPNEVLLPPALEGLNSLEGYLFPGEYQLRKDSTVVELIQLFLAGFQTTALPSINSSLQNTGLSLQEVVTLASIIQRESLVNSELPTVASVFYNRLDVGMKLETDPTVQYAIGYDENSNSWWKTPALPGGSGFPIRI